MTAANHSAAPAAGWTPLRTSAERPVLVRYQHRPGGYCLASTVRNLLEHQGLRLTEEQVVGLGAAVCFRYGGNVSTRRYWVEVCSSGVEMTLFANLGMWFRHRRSGSAEDAEARMVELLRAGTPVAVKLNPTFCEGVMRKTPAELVPHLATHWAVVHGWDPERREVHFSDNTRFAPYVLPAETFRLARTSGKDSQNPRNMWLEVHLHETPVPMNAVYRAALGQTLVSFRYLQGGEGHRGLDALTRFVRHVRAWGSTLDAAGVRENALAMMGGIALGGSLRGAGRGYLARFLVDAAERLDAPLLVPAAAGFRDSAALWNEVYAGFRELAAAPDSPAPLARGSAFLTALEETVSAERGAIVALEAALRHRPRACAVVVAPLPSAEVMPC